MQHVRWLYLCGRENRDIKYFTGTEIIKASHLKRLFYQNVLNIVNLQFDWVVCDMNTSP